jgi:hypothetical protein
MVQSKTCDRNDDARRIAGAPRDLHVRALADPTSRAGVVVVPKTKKTRTMVKTRPFAFAARFQRAIYRWVALSTQGGARSASWLGRKDSKGEDKGRGMRRRGFMVARLRVSRGRSAESSCE